MACLPFSPTALHQADLPLPHYPRLQNPPAATTWLLGFYNWNWEATPSFNEQGLKHSLQSSDNYVPIDPPSIQAFNVSESKGMGFYCGSYLTFSL